MYLTEEKMAQRLHGLHISNEYTDHEFSHHSQDNPPQRKMPAKSLQELEERLSDYLQEFELEEAPSSNETFRLPPELQKTISQSDLILPQEIFKELNKPCLEIVLWKPSSDLVKETVKTFTKSESLTPNSEKTNNNNNNTLQQGESPEMLTAVLRHPVTNMDFLLPNFPSSASNNDDTMDL